MSSILIPLDSCLQTCTTHTIAECTWNKLQMMDGGTVRNMWSFVPKYICEISASSWVYYKEIHRSFSTFQVINTHPVRFWLIYIFSQQSHINTTTVTWHETNTHNTKPSSSTNNRTCLTQHDHKATECRSRTVPFHLCSGNHA